MSPAQARTVLAGSASTISRRRLVAAASAQLTPLHQQAARLGGTTTYRQAVLATRITAYTGASRARVWVWTLLTISHTNHTNPEPHTKSGPGSGSGSGDSNASGVFVTSDLRLIWQAGAWRLDASSDTGGPTPLIDGTPSTGAQMTSALSGFADWRPA